MLTAQPLLTVEPMCGDCKFWVVGEYVGCASYDTFDHEHFGACKRYPAEEEKFDTEWCGEYRPRTPATDSTPLTKRIAEDAKPCPRPPDIVD